MATAPLFGFYQYFNFHYRISDEGEALDVLKIILEQESSLQEHPYKRFLEQFQQCPVIWENVRQRVCWERFENWMKMTDVSDISIPRHLGKSIEVAAKPIITTAANVIATTIEQFNSLVTSNIMTDDEPVLVTPLWDLRPDRKLRGVSFRNLQTNAAMTVDMAYLGDDILRLGEILEKSPAVHVFWSQEEYLRIKWILALRFQRILLLGDTFLKLLGPKLTPTAFAALLTSQTEVRRRIEAINTAVQGQDFSYADLAFQEEILTLVFHASLRHFPETLDEGLAQGTAVNFIDFPINKPELKLESGYRGKNTVFTKVTTGKDFLARLHKVCELLLWIPQWMPELLAELSPPNGTHHVWFRRAMLQQRLQAQNFEHDLCLTDEEFEVAVRHGSCSYDSDVLEVKIPQNAAQTKDLFQKYVAAADCPMIIVPVHSKDYSLSFPRGLAVFVPQKNLVLILDGFVASLDFFAMVDMVDETKNTKIFWNTKDALRAKIFCGMNLRNAVVLQECLGESAELRQCPLQSLATIVSCNVTLRGAALEIQRQLLDNDRDMAEAAMRAVGLAKLADELFRYGTAFVKDAIPSYHRSVDASPFGQPFAFMTETGVVEYFAGRGFTLRSSFRPGVLQAECDVRLLHKAYLWRAIVALDTGIGPRHVLHDAAIWDAAFLHLTPQGLDVNQWVAYHEKYSELMPAERWEDAKTSWGQQSFSVDNCNLCSFGAGHQRFCAVGNILATIKTARQGVDLQKYYEAVGATSEKTRKSVQQIVSKMFRIGEKFHDCPPKRKPQKDLYRVDFFRDTKAKCTLPMNYEILLRKFATKWTLPLTNFTEISSAPIVVPPKDLVWEYGAFFVPCCLYHGLGLPPSVRLLHGVMTFSYASKTPTIDWDPSALVNLTRPCLRKRDAGDKKQ